LDSATSYLAGGLARRFAGIAFDPLIPTAGKPDFPQVGVAAR